MVSVTGKNSIVGAASILGLVLSLISTSVLATGSGQSGDDNYAGATCASCHSGNTYSTGNNLAINISGMTNVAIGAALPITLQITNSPAGADNGFSATVRNGATRVGSFTESDADVQTGTEVNPNDYVTHNGPRGSRAIFSFNWIAPTAPVSGLLLHTCVNQVGDNLDDDTTNDGPPVCANRAINVVNTAPNAVNDTAATTENTTTQLNVLTAGVNDSDGDAAVVQPLTVTSVSQPTSAPNGTTSGGVTNGLVTYNPNGQFEYLAVGESTTDVFTYVLSDGLNTDVGTVTITVNGVNDIPSVSVNGNPLYQEGDSPVTLDALISVSDADITDQINRARVVITNYQPGEDELDCAGVSPGITSCNFNAGTLELLGLTSRSNYANALETVTYTNTSLNPTAGDRTITFEVRDDNFASSVTDTVTVSVSAVSTAPSIASFTGVAAFTEGSPIQVNGAVIITDPDSTVLNRATMILTAPNYMALEDVLVCPTVASLPSGISCVYNAGTLTLSSATTNSYADYSNAIALVSYNNISESPNATARAVSLTVRDDSNTVVTPAVLKSISVTPVNDPPVITSVAMPVTATEGITYNYTPTAVDPDDNAAGISFAITAAPAGSTFNTATGAFSWTPPRTNIFNNAITQFTIDVEDGDEDNSARDFENINLVVSPPDADADGVADYADNCPNIANGINQDNQADNDNDTQYMANAGFPVIGDVDSSAPATGGDACDTDDDNDGMLDADELLFPSCLDPLNASDATEDCDGDGINNITEVNDGDAATTPDADNVGPTVNAPANITIDATGLLTAVNLGAASGSDGNDGQSTIFKAVVNLTQAEKDALAVPVTGCQLLSDYQADINPFRPGTYNVTWVTCDSSGNSGQDDQSVNVKPLVGVTAGQSVGEGQSVNVEITLNGNAIAYPATVGYTVTGTALAIDDHDGADGVVSFSGPGVVGMINFNTLVDGVTEGDETVVITLHTPTNMALSNSRVHTVTISEANLVPQAVLNVSQTVILGNKVYQPDGIVSVVADAIDGNGDNLSYSWVGTDEVILNNPGTGITLNQLDFDPTSLILDNLYTVQVTVSDGSSEITVQRLLQISAAPAALTSVDSDGDGVNDDDVTEGYGDSDSDGIPNYLDNSSTPANAIENHTVNLETRLYIETNPGLKIALGETAIAAQSSGLSIDMQDIINFGGAGGTAVLNATSDHIFFSDLLDFEISGLTDDIESVDVVIPLRTAIQQGFAYRKYNASGWFDFVEDDLNQLRTAVGSDGTCPPVGSNVYTDGLTIGDLCLQLTIQDGGLNDADGLRNFVVKDPGGLALTPEVEEVAADTSSDGRAGSLGLWFILMFAFAIIALWRIRVDTANATTEVKARFK